MSKLTLALTLLSLPLAACGPDAVDEAPAASDEAADEVLEDTGSADIPWDFEFFQTGTDADPDLDLLVDEAETEVATRGYDFASFALEAARGYDDAAAQTWRGLRRTGNGNMAVAFSAFEAAKVSGWRATRPGSCASRVAHLEDARAHASAGITPAYFACSVGVSEGCAAAQEAIDAQWAAHYALLLDHTCR